jgi:hypothetical protein
MATGDPGTITFSTETVGGGALGVSATGINAGVQGGGVAPLQTVRSGSDWFDSTGGMRMPDNNLPEFLEEITAPNRKALEQQQMWDGFVAARSGKTMDEIADEQPWYSKLFGPTNYEIGAQNYNVLESVSVMEQDLITRMPDLRKLPPEALAQEFNRLAQGQMTGNMYADAVLQKTFMDRAGPLMDLHTKERVAWQQAELVKAQYASNSANSTSFNEMARRTALLGNKAPGEEGEADKLVQSQLSLLDGLSPSAYQTDDSYKAAMTAFVRGAADRGEFYTLKFLNSRGVLSALDPDDALQLTAYVKQKQAQYKSEWLDTNPSAAEQMALVSLYASEGIGAKPTEAQIDQLNTAYAAATGSDDPLYSGTQRMSMMAQSAGAHIRAQEAVLRERAAAQKAANTETAKLAAQQEDVRAAIDSWRHGTYAQTVNIPGVDKELLDANVVQGWNQTLAKNPQVAMAQLVWNANTGRGVVLKGVADQFQTTARAVLREQPNDAARDLYNQWRMMKNTNAQRLSIDGKPVTGRLSGATTASLYFGDSVNTMFNKLQALEESGVAFELAYEVARGEITTDDPTEFNANSRKESEAQQARVADVLQKSNPAYFGYFGNKLGDSGRQAASRAIVRAVGESGGLLDTSSEGITAALNLAKLKYGGEDAGKYYWENGRDDEGHVIGSVGAWLGFMDTKETGPAIEAAIDATLRANNVEPSKSLKADVFRMRDSESGEPVLYVNTVGERGWKVVAVTGAAIKAEYERRRKAATRTQIPVPQGYVRMPDGSIQESIAIQPKM